MLFSILIIFICVLIYVSFNYKNRLTLVFSLYMLSIGVLMFSVLLYSSKFMNYHASFEFDYYLYMLVNHMRCNVTDVARIYNIGAASLMIASVCVSTIINKNRWQVIALLLVPVALFLFINDPQVDYIAFLRILSNPNGESTLAMINSIKMFLSDIILMFYIIMPLCYLYVYYKRTRLKIKKIHAIISAICIVLIEMFVIFIITSGPIGNMNRDVDILKFPRSYSDWSYSVTSLLVMLFVFLAVFVLTCVFKPFGSYDSIRRSMVVKNSKMLSKNLKLLFHVYKNSFLAVNKLAKQADEYIEKDIKITHENLDFIQRKSDEAILSIGNIIDIINDDSSVDLKREKDSEGFDIKKCIDAAIAKVHLPENLELVIIYDENENNPIFGDVFHITEAFVNIIHNALEAMSANETPRLEIIIDGEDEWVSVEFADNGYGIKKKDMKYIFNPLYSTKHSLNNWGIGLSYVEKVVKAHMGYVFVESQEHQYTKFQLLFPRAEEKVGIIKKLQKFLDLRRA